MTAPTTRETADHAELLEDALEAIQIIEAFPSKQGEVEGRITEKGDRMLAACTTNIRACQAALLSEIAALRGERDRLRTAVSKSNDEICQSLGKALGYPWFKDDQANFPGSTETDGVCVGDHVAESIADEAARRLTQAERQRDELQKALKRISYTPDGEDGLSLNECVNLARAFLANQGADQCRE